MVENGMYFAKADFYDGAIKEKRLSGFVMGI